VICTVSFFWFCEFVISTHAPHTPELFQSYSFIAP